MISAEQLEVCTQNLYVYDVVQGAWPFKGLLENAIHVERHLAKDIGGKDFTDPKTIQFAIAPDSVEYAIRLARYTDFEEEDMILAAQERPAASKLGTLSTHATAFVAANQALSSNLHDLEHPNLRNAAIKGHQDAIKEPPAC